MEIYQLKTFLVVAREGHLTRAAERLHISQPAVSAQIKSLEQELGVTLFQRKHSGVQLTKAARTLLPQAEKVLAAATELMSQAKRLTGRVVGRLTLGIILNPEFIRLGDLTNHLLSRYPLLDIDIRHRNSITVLASIRAQELDASFYLGRDVPADMSFVVLRELTYRVVGSIAWAARLASAGWEEIAEFPWIATPKEGSFYQMTNEMFRARGLSLRTVIEADQESAIINLVQSGVGLGLMREALAVEAAKKGQVVIWEKGKAASMLSLISLASRRSDPIIRTLYSAVQAVWGVSETGVLS